MARKKRPQKPVTRGRITKKNLYSQRLEQAIVAHHRESEFKTKFKLTKSSKKSFRKYYEKRLEKELVDFVRDSRRYGWGNKYIFQTKVSLNIRGKRMKQYISLPRRKISSLRSAKKYAKQYLDRILKLCDRYMKRQGFRSITIKGTRGEAVKRRSVRANASRRGKRKK